MTRSKTSIELTSRRTTRALFGILGILVVLHLIVVVFHTVFHVRLEALTQLVDLDLEGNIPTFFNSALFFLGAGVFFLHGRSAATKERNGWYLMTFVFLFLGLDEGSQIHEKFLQFTFRLLQHGSEGGTDLGWFYYAWVIPYGLAALVLAAVLSRWFMKLEPQLRKGLIISGTIYVFGAIFLEMAGGKLVSGSQSQPASDFPWMPCGLYGDPASCWLFMDYRYIALYTMEEICEMTGLILCIRFLLEAFERKGLFLSLNLKQQD